MAAFSTSIELTEMESDALAELVNLGVGRAAASLRQMVGKEVILSVPSVEVMRRDQAARLMAERDANGVVAVHQNFVGAFSGCALLIFPEANSLELVRAVTGSDLSLEDIIDLEQEALAETGNIVLNACLATMANVLKRNLTMSLPTVHRGNGQSLLSDSCGDVPGDLLLFLYINFMVSSQDIRGYIAMIMDLPSLESLRALIGDYVASLAGDVPLSTHGVV